MIDLIFTVSLKLIASSVVVFLLIMPMGLLCFDDSRCCIPKTNTKKIIYYTLNTFLVIDILVFMLSFISMCIFGVLTLWV